MQSKYKYVKNIKTTQVRKDFRVQSDAGLAEHPEHILLVRLNTGLVKGIYARHISGQSAGKLEEADKCRKSGLVPRGNGDGDVRNAARDMRCLDRLGSRKADIEHILSSKIVQAVRVAHLKRNGIAAHGPIKPDDSLHERAGAVLYILPHGVQVGGELDRGGVDADTDFALALTLKLLPPLCHEAEGGLVAAEYLNAAAVAVHMLPCGGVLPGGVFG